MIESTGSTLLLPGHSTPYNVTGSPFAASRAAASVLTCCGYSSGSRWKTSHPRSDQRQPSAARRSSSGVAFGRRSSRLVIESCTLCDSRLWLGRRGRLCVSYTRRAWSPVHVVPIASHVDDVDVDCCTVCCSDTHGRSPRPCATPLFECLLLPHGRHWCSCVVYTVERRSRTPVGGVGEHEEAHPRREKSSRSSPRRSAHPI